MLSKNTKEILEELLKTFYFLQYKILNIYILYNSYRRTQELQLLLLYKF